MRCASSNRCAAALAVVLVCLGFGAPSADAQIIYEPVRYQYGGQNAYYYGGCDPRVHEAAAWPWAPGTTWGRGNGWAFRSASIDTHREVASERQRTYTDAMPLRNAWVYGFTANDARNEAYARQPNYFRKIDLLRAARPAADGRTLVVPECWSSAAPAMFPAGAIVIRPSRAATGIDLPRGPRPVMVIPRNLLEGELAPDAPTKEIDPALLTRAE